MEPYYDQDGVTIWHGDCREILPSLPPVDLVLTDPPYGMDYQSARRTKWQRKPKIHGDGEYPTWIFDLRPRVALMAWCRWDNIRNMPQPKSLIVWDKMRHGMGDLRHEFGRQWEACAFYPGHEHEFTGRPVDVIRSACVPAADLIHPNEKPMGAIMPLIRCHGTASVVLDPFAGSGVTLVAARDAGRRAIGIEIEERYCEIAAKRLGQRVLDFSQPGAVDVEDADG